ncbi:MAG: hypothetical protein M3Y72_27525 [Acidobacteriota bacterium]|nr:hypothetical protein [Acidobacteriota bacterium]
MLNLWLGLTMLIQFSLLSADPIRVRYTEGSVHGFLALRTPEGKIIAAGDLTQVVRGDRAVSRLVFHFKDGSIDDETASFSQRGNFRLISDHHIQKGPMFPKSTGVSINAISGQVTVRYKDKDQEKVETDHLDLPPDLANGILLEIVKNIAPDTITKLSYLVATPKPKIVKLSIVSQGEETFSVASAHHKATLFNIKVELGGLTGVIAPLIGKQPADTEIWVAEGEAPAFVRSEGPFYLGGPIWTIEMTSPVWRKTSNPGH